MKNSRRSVVTDFAWALLDGGLLTLIWMALHELRFGHLPPFHRGPFFVIPSLVGLQWFFGSYSALNDGQSCYRDHLQRYFFSTICVIAWFVVVYALSGKTLDISIGQGFLLPLLFSGLLSAMLIMLLESCRHFWQPQAKWLVMVSREQRALLAREVEHGGCEIPAALEWRPRRGSTSLPLQLPQLLEMNGVLLGRGGLLSENDQAVLLRWQEAGVELMPLLPWCERYLRRIPSELLPSDPADLEWMLRQTRHRHLNRLKTLMDWIIGLALLGPSAVLMMVLVIARFLEGYRRPLLVKTTCLGRAGVPFLQLRFAGDPFPVPALNSLPQVWNVLKGEMSLVGPRPVTADVQKVLEHKDQAFRLRLRLQPGMTGWGRLSGAASEEADSLRWELQRDLYYLCHFSLDLDLSILLRAATKQFLVMFGAR